MKYLFKAITTASACHRDQRRDDTNEPYINHCLEVMRLVHDLCGFDENTLSAAVLHDVVEDTYYSMDDVKYHFNPEISFLVKILTDDPDCDNVKERRESQINRLIENNNLDANNIKIADKISNCNDLISKYCTRSKKSIANYFKFSKKLCDSLEASEKIKNQFYLLYELAKKDQLKGFL